MRPKRTTKSSRPPHAKPPQSPVLEAGGMHKNCPIDLDSLTPLERQRLEAAVRMLVRYLVSASAGGGDVL